MQSHGPYNKKSWRQLNITPILTVHFYEDMMNITSPEKWLEENCKNTTNNSSKIIKSQSCVAAVMRKWSKWQTQTCRQVVLCDKLLTSTMYKTAFTNKENIKLIIT